METIITLLLILIPIIFKAVGKKFEDAGKVQSTGSEDQIDDWAEVLRQHMDIQNTNIEKQLPDRDVTENKTVHIHQEMPKYKPIERQKQHVEVQHADKPVKKDKIDPKKLIVYSEIMNPKYTD